MTKHATADDVIVIFDTYFELLTSTSTLGQVVTTTSGVEILSVTRTQLLEFINSHLTTTGFSAITCNCMAWREFLSERIQPPSRLCFESALKDARHQPPTGKIMGKSQKLTLKFSAQGIVH